MSDNPKRFEGWHDVDCNECSHYWDNSCDSFKKGTVKACSSYNATRSVVIPEQIKDLQRQIKDNKLSILVLTILFLLFIVAHTVGWL